MNNRMQELNTLFVDTFDAIRQVEEMARLVRRHPCNILFSYMNEPWANANNEPHRHMLHHERETLYGIFDQILRYSHPDAVIKHVDGDFDPPTAKHLYRNLLT